MSDCGKSRLAYGLLFALIAALLVAFANPADRIKADLRADAEGLVLSFEYTAHLVEGG